MRRENASGGFEELDAVAGELHVFDDGGSERAVDGVEDGGAKAGMEFFGDGGAADGRALLQHERFVSGTGEVKRGNEGILAGADDDDVAEF